jgi:hypothetical protein
VDTGSRIDISVGLWGAEAPGGEGKAGWATCGHAPPSLIAHMHTESIISGLEAHK